MARSLRRFAPLELAVGHDSDLSISLYDSTGTALDVTGASASWDLRKGVPRRRRKPWKGNSVLSKTSVAGTITLATGLATVAIADTDLSGASGWHWHTLQITDSSGNVTHLGEGKLFLRAGL